MGGIPAINKPGARRHINDESFSLYWSTHACSFTLIDWEDEWYSVLSKSIGSDKVMAKVMRYCKEILVKYKRKDNVFDV